MAKSKSEKIQGIRERISKKETAIADKRAKGKPVAVLESELEVLKTKLRVEENKPEGGRRGGTEEQRETKALRAQKKETQKELSGAKKANREATKAGRAGCRAQAKIDYENCANVVAQASFAREHDDIFPIQQRLDAINSRLPPPVRREKVGENIERTIGEMAKKHPEHAEKFAKLSDELRSSSGGTVVDDIVRGARAQAEADRPKRSSRRKAA